MLRTTLMLVCLSVSVNALSATKLVKKPAVSEGDKRFVTYVYKEGTPNINPIIATVGKFTEIQFSEAEGKSKIFYAMGDKEGWTIKQNGNIFLMKPSASFAATNMKIWTNKKRVYWFDVSMAKGSKEPIFHAEFVYPNEPVLIEAVDPAEEAAKLQAAAIKKDQDEKQLIEDRLGGLHQTKDAPLAPRQEHIINGDYGVIGAKELTPTSAYDNGELTVLTFAPNNPVPDVFFKEADGTESRVSSHFENDMMIIHRVARKLVLRRGDAVACLVNGSFNPTGSNSTTKTVSDDVVRETRF